MEIAIIGAGAMGTLYGGWLAERNQVSFIDSAKTAVDAINACGVKIEYDTEKKDYKNVKAFCSGQYPKKAELVIVFVKSNYTEDAMEQNKNIIGENTVVMTLQNGLGNDEIIAKYVPADRIVTGICRHNAKKLSPSSAKYMGGKYTAIGSRWGSEAHAEKIGKVFNESGIYTIIDEDIMRAVWSKVFVNATMNPLTAIFDMPNGFITDDPYAWKLSQEIVREAAAVAEAEGIKFDISEADESVRFSCEIAYNGFTSMYQDIKKKVKTEVDYINGAIVRLGEKHGIETPCNRHITEIIHGMEGAYFYKK